MEAGILNESGMDSAISTSSDSVYNYKSVNIVYRLHSSGRESRLRLHAWMYKNHRNLLTSAVLPSTGNISSCVLL